MLERSELYRTAQATLQGTRHHARKESGRPSGRARDANHQCSSPTLEAQVAQAHERDVPTEMLRPRAHVRLVSPGPQAVANAAANLGTEGASELARGLAPRVLAQSLEQEIRQIHARLPFIVAQLTPAQIADDGAGRVETRGHGQKGAGKWQYRGRVAQAVKSRASGQSARRGLRAWLILGLLTPTWEPPDASARIEPSDSVESGFEPGQSPPARGQAANGRATAPAWLRCSLSRPVCVESSDPTLIPAALRLLTEAYEVAILGNQGPAWGLDRLAEPLRWRLEARALAFEVAPEPALGFARGRPACAGGPVTLGTALSCVTGSALTRIAPKTPEPLVQGAASYFSHAYASDDPLPRAGGSQPELGLLTGPGRADAALILESIADKASPGREQAAVWLALTLPASRAPWGTAASNPEPDFFDVLRSTLGAQDPHLAQFFDELGILRFTRGRDSTATKGGAAAESRTLELAWEIDGRSLPRNLVLPRPLLPTGSAYVAVRLDPATKKAGLAVRAFCEAGSRYVWSLSRLGEGRVLQSRVPVPARESGTSAEGAIVDLDAAHEVLVVGTSLGGGPGEAFDPDVVPFAAHSCEVALDRLPSR